MNISQLLSELFPDERLPYEWAAQGNLMLKVCSDCGSCLPPHRLVCPACHSPDLVPKIASGKGKIYAHTAVQTDRQSPVMTRIAMIELDEGPRVIGRLIGAEDTPSIGEAVVTTFEAVGDDLAVPVFKITSNETE